MSIATPHTQDPAPTYTRTVGFQMPTVSPWRKPNAIGVLGSALVVVALGVILVLARTASVDRPSTSMATGSARDGALDAGDPRAGALDDWLLSTLGAGVDQTDARSSTYELSVTNDTCSFVRVNSVPATRSPNHIYASGQDIVELHSQLCPGAAR